MVIGFFSASWRDGRPRFRPSGTPVEIGGLCWRFVDIV
jgi:hypothetical protein